MLFLLRACYTLAEHRPWRNFFMRNRFGYALHLLLLLTLTACVSSPPATVIPDQTDTPVPTETTSTEITLYRGNAQRTGVFDFPAIRE